MLPLSRIYIHRRDSCQTLSYYAAFFQLCFFAGQKNVIYNFSQVLRGYKFLQEQGILRLVSVKNIESLNTRK